MLAAAAAIHWAYTTGPADACAELARAALAGGDLTAADNGLLSISSIFVLAMADRDDTTAAWELAIADAHRRGSLFAVSAINLWRGGTSYYRGEMIEAEAMLGTALDQFELWGYGNAGLLYLRAFLCATLVSRGDLRGAWQQIKAAEDPGDLSDGARFYLMARADLLMTESRWAETLDVLDELERRFPWVTNPVIHPINGIRSIALYNLGRREEGLACAEKVLALAWQWGKPTTIGPGLRVLAGMKGGDEGVAMLRQAVELLEGTLNRLQQAKALLSLGQMLLERGEAEEARLHLRRALELGEASGARPIVDRARTELMKSGVRPTLGAPIGRATLTATERRVAELAAEGQTEREIAQLLYETPNAVSGHLDAACHKLGVSDHDQLRLVLAPG
jgi:DNA-binding CsgD family transcriptional regulator